MENSIYSDNEEILLSEIKGGKKAYFVMKEIKKK